VVLTAQPCLFLVGRFLKIFLSETAQPNEPKLGKYIKNQTERDIDQII
jgi:hypothetical protein